MQPVFVELCVGNRDNVDDRQRSINGDDAYILVEFLRSLSIPPDQQWEEVEK